ncbi:MAG: acyltransferase [Alphaproteobacteria bacterium]|nr:acyltransferase [Alphaproteobacteria bacterium]
MIVIGNDTVIGRNVDIIGDVEIGDHCSVTSHSILQSASHYKNSPTFAGFVHPIIIENYVWIGNMSVILPGVVIKTGTIVGAHSTVCRNIGNFEIVAGCPSKVLGKRDEQICRYVLNYRPPFN